MNNILLYLSVKFKGDWRAIFNFISKKEDCDVEEVKSFINNYKGSKYITILDNNYPEYFKNIFEPPFVLFYKGDLSLLNDSKRVGVIGSRDYSSYGEKACKILTKDMVDNGITIISGLAKGIDMIAHKSCLENNGRTIAVVGHGLDFVYPQSNKQLFDDIINYDGLIISEYPDTVLPTKEKFPYRNRLISGICQKLLVIEAKSKSGTSITVNHALSQGRDILCVPNNIFSDSNCNRLIKQGAKLVENIDDILEEF